MVAAGVQGAAPPTVRLPNGLAVRYVSRQDVPFLFKEVFTDQSYLRHGVCLPLRHSSGGGGSGGSQVAAPRPAVIDCGANVGLFSLFAAERLGPRGLVIACEPLPPTYECLQHNVAAHQQWLAAEQQQQPAAAAQVVALQVGVGDGSSETAEFTHYPQAAGWSTAYPSEAEVTADMGAFLENSLAAGGKGGAGGMDPRLASLGAALQRAAPRWLYNAVWRGAVRRMLASGVQRYHCRLRTVSEIIQEHGLLSVDLLKVDVERAELDVLRGIADHHWPMIHQAAIEVHECNLEAALAILRGPAAFSSVHVEQTAELRGSSLVTVFCTRT